MRTGIIIGVLVVCLYLLAAFLISYLMFRVTFRKYRVEKYSAIAHWSFYKDRYHRKVVHFPSGENQLTGYLFTSKAEQPKKGLIVFSHGIWSGPSEYLMLLTWFVDQGWDVFAYSYTAYDESEGRSAKGLPQSMIDLHAALKFLDRTPELYDSELPRVLMGHSWGAYATCAVLRHKHKVEAAVALSGFSDPVEISVSVGRSAVGPIGGTFGWMIKLFNKVLFKSEGGRTAVQGINAVDIPILLVHGLKDGFIRYESTSIVCHRDELTNNRVEYLILDDPAQCDHNNYFGNADTTSYYDEVMKEFAEVEKAYPKKKVPLDVRKRFFSKVDLVRASQPNVALYEKIEKFLERAVL